MIYVNVWQRANGDQFISNVPTPVRSFLNGRTISKRDSEPHPKRVGVLHIRMKDTTNG